MPRIRIDESGLKRARYGNGSVTRNLSLLSWPLVQGIAPAGVGQYGSAVVDLAVYLLDVVVNPTNPRMRATLDMLRAGFPGREALLALSDNLTSLSEMVRLLALEVEKDGAP